MMEERVQRYDIAQRAYHWVNLAALLLLLWTGLTIYDLNLLGVKPLSAFAAAVIGEVYTPLIFEIHRYAAFVLLGALMFHIVYDTGIRGVFWSELPSRADFRAQNITAKNFLGLSKEYIKFPRYNPGQKMLHIGFAAVVLLVGATGFMLSANYRWLVPIWWLNIDFDVLFFWVRITHDLLTFALVAMVVMHFYFAIRKENWPTFKSMVAGWVPKSYQEKHFAAGEEPEIIPAPDEGD
ncbi:MAG: cytochrome b/b6 domain-containing protein [Nitrososphaerales archaeon]